MLQIATLKDQLSQEMRKRQQYISRSVKTGEEIADIRSMLDHSLTKVAYDPSIDPDDLPDEWPGFDQVIDDLRILSHPRRSQAVD